jgi:hypothetical protein
MAAVKPKTFNDFEAAAKAMREQESARNPSSARLSKRRREMLACFG